MVNMTHNTNYRRSRNHIILIFIIFFQKFFNHIYLNFSLADNIILDCNILCSLISYLLINGYNLPLKKQFLDNSRWLYLHLVSKILNCDCLWKCNNLNLFLNSLNSLLFRLNKLTRFILTFYIFEIISILLIH